MHNTVTIHGLPATERPRERLNATGADSLSNTEFAAVPISRGIPGKSVMSIADELTTRFRSVKGIGDVMIEQLSVVKGAGRSAYGHRGSVSCIIATRKGCTSFKERLTGNGR
jgi:DNA repair protein RadC